MKAVDLIFNALLPVLETLSPSARLNAVSARIRVAMWRQHRALQQSVRRHLFPNGKISVLSGPFQGMLYLNEIVWGPITPRWLGSYESELHPLIQQIIQRAYNCVIDVGSAEGFYAVGLARAIPNCHVYAYDIDFISRRQVRRLAQLNNVHRRITIGGYCRHSEIQATAVPHDTILICDIEGLESDLLNPAQCPALRTTDILVEIHDLKINPLNEETLTERFASSHTIQRIEETSRLAWLKAHQQLMSSLPENLHLPALSEGRHKENPQVWLRLTVRPS